MMTFRNLARTVVLALALLCALPARADYEAGRQAWDAGRPDEALAQWRAAADGGDRRAMLALGRLYAQGLGAPQDYVEAHKWFNLAASRGEAAAVGERDALAAKMTPQQVQAAQELARSWRPVGRAVAGAGGSGTAGRTGATATAPDAGAPPPRAIREAQELLAGLGYAPGPADGTWGRRTGQAYQAFLRDAGLPPAQRLTPEALRAMRALARGELLDRTAPSASEAPRASAGAGVAPAAAAAVPPDALHRAAQAGNIASLQAALAAGAVVDARDRRGWTALMYAVDKGYPLLVEPLLAAGADPDVRAPDGATALFMAAVHGHTEVIGLLMEAGADPRVKGPKGKTARDVARTRYGEVMVVAAKENGEPPAVMALLEGRTLAEEPLVPLCALGALGGCWIEVSNQPGCWMFRHNPTELIPGKNNEYHTYDEVEVTMTWSGECASRKPSGQGKEVLHVRAEGRAIRDETSDVSRTLVKEGEGSYVDGKRHGRWVEDRLSIRDYKDGTRYESRHVREMSYVDGILHGRWVSDDFHIQEHDDDDYYESRSVTEIPYVNGGRHGLGVEKYGGVRRGRGNAELSWVVETPYVDGMAHGLQVKKQIRDGVVLETTP